MLPYHQSLVYFIMLATRDGDGRLADLFLTFEDALDVIRKVHNLTCGMPKIVYLVGWHHEGHDSKYPDWNEVNRHLKRAQDDMARDSLRWMMRAARRYGATVSLHVNMFDAYRDSPLWDEYAAQDLPLLARPGHRRDLGMSERIPRGSLRRLAAVGVDRRHRDRRPA